MGKLIYVTNMSLDGYIEDERGAFDWFPPDDEVFAFTTNLLRSVGTFLYGRRLYESMAVWETNTGLAGQSELMADFASVWKAANKVVYSTTLAAVSTADTRLERQFDPAAIRQLKATTSSDLTVGGANLATQAFKARLWTSTRCSSGPLSSAGESQGCRAAYAPTLSSSMSADSEMGSYTFATAFSDNDRKFCPIAGARMTGGALTTDSASGGRPSRTRVASAGPGAGYPGFRLRREDRPPQRDRGLGGCCRRRAPRSDRRTKCGPGDYLPSRGRPPL